MIDQEKYHAVTFWNHHKGGEWRRLWTSEPCETFDEALDTLKAHWDTADYPYYPGSGYGRAVLHQRRLTYVTD